MNFMTARMFFNVCAYEWDGFWTCGTVHVLIELVVVFSTQFFAWVCIILSHIITTITNIIHELWPQVLSTEWEYDHKTRAINCIYFCSAPWGSDRLTTPEDPRSFSRCRSDSWCCRYSTCFARATGDIAAAEDSDLMFSCHNDNIY